MSEKSILKYTLKPILPAIQQDYTLKKSVKILSEFTQVIFIKNYHISILIFIHKIMCQLLVS